MTCVQLRTKTRTSISGKICCVKSGFQILYVIEQLSSLFSKDKLKQGAHIHQTHDPPSPGMSWENCRAAPSQQLPPVFYPTGSPRLAARNYTRLGLHSRHCGDFCCDFRGVCFLVDTGSCLFVVSCVASFLVVWPIRSSLVSGFGLLSVFSPEWIRAPVIFGSTSVRA